MPLNFSIVNIQLFKILQHRIQQISLLILGAFLLSCQSYEQTLFASDSSLEWAREQGAETLPVWVDFDSNETGTRTLYFQIKQNGIPSNSDETIEFSIDTLQSTAILGQHFQLPGGTSIQITQGASLSDSIAVEVLGSALEGDRDLRLVLNIETTPSPVQARRELILYISKPQSSFPVHTLHLQSPGSNSGLNMVNLDTLGVYSRTQANQDESLQKVTDFGFWSSSSKAYVFIVPTSYRLSGWSSGKTIQEDWDLSNRNDGIFMKLPPGAENDLLFTGTQTRQDFVEAFKVARERTKRLDTYDYGPHGHVHLLEEGDIVFFHSLSRNIRAIMRVESATSGGSGSLELSVKRLINYN